MENVTQPGQIVFLVALGLVAFVALAIWFYRGVRGGVRAEPKVSDIITAALDWRPTPITSSHEDVPDVRQSEREQRSYAVEQSGNSPTGTRSDLISELGNMTEDQLLTILSQVKDEDGGYRFAESKIGRFVGGRLEDRITQVRAVRGTPIQANQYMTPVAARPTKAAFHP